MFECECCERRNVVAKSRGLGYICDDCMGHATEERDVVPSYASCPFRVTTS